MSTLIAGPWTGEFGWELISWQGWVRVRAQGYKQVVVSAPAGHEALYETATVFVPHTMNGKKDCWRLLSPNPKEQARVEQVLSQYSGDRMRPNGYVNPAHQQFVKLGNRSRVTAEQRYDVLVHARKPVGKRSYHTWNPSDAAQVVRGLAGMRVGFIGTNDAYPVEGADDLRNLPLNRLCDLIAAAQLVISPASGPALLSGLCGTPYLCWTDGGYRSAVRERDDKRTKGSWNPLGTTCKVLVRKDWRPDPNVLVKHAEEMLIRKRREADAAMPRL